MKDTSPEMEQRFRAMLLARSEEERLKMGCSMQAFAQQVVRASVLAGAPQATTADLRCAMFLRFYAGDFDERTREKILSALRQPANSSPSPPAGANSFSLAPCGRGQGEGNAETRERLIHDG